MSKWMRRALVAAPVLAVASVLAAPYFRADQYKAQIQQNLERVLGRRVDLQGEARFQLYPRPGVSLSRVVIHELPALGLEPVAYLDYPDSSLDVSLSPLALIMGRVKVTGVRLVAPSLNLTKSNSGQWTFQPLIEKAMGEGRAAGFDLDAIQVQGARLNFKIGDVKSLFYLADTDLRIEADSGNTNRYGMTIEGDPARTDRTSSSFGRLTGRGMLSFGRGNDESRIDLNLSINRTPLAEIVSALQGRGIGLGGFVASQAKLSGPLSQVKIEGTLQLAEAERFRWLLPRAASGRGRDFTGTLDWPGQELRLRTVDHQDPAASPVSLRLRAFDLFRQPRWALLLGIDKAPLGSVRALAGELALTLPAETPLEGGLSGVMGYSSQHGAHGQLAMAQASVAVPAQPAPVTVNEARVIVDGLQWRVPAAEIRLSEHESVTVESLVDMASGRRDLTAATAGLDVEQSRAIWRQLAGADPLFFDRCQQGRWAGTLRYSQESASAPAGWAGDLRVMGAVCSVAGLADPVRVQSAQVSIRGAAMAARRVVALVGDLAVTGEMDYDPARWRFARLRLSTPSVSMAAIERLLLPALRRDAGFISRTLGRRVPVPEWLARRRAEAVLSVGALDQRFETVEARLVWDGTQIDIPEWKASAWRGAMKGRAHISLEAAEPVYSGSTTLTDAAWRDGRANTEAAWETAGVGGARLLAALKAQGTFHAKGTVLAEPDAALDAITGKFAWAAGRLQLNGAQWTTVAGETFEGQGSAAADGKLSLEPAGGRGARVSGRLW